MKTKPVKVGIMSYGKYKKYTMAIANGKYTPKKREPKIWFNSIETMSQVLSTRNVELLKLIEREQPQSISELAEKSGRKQGNLSRTLSQLSKYGIVDLKKEKKNKVPIVIASAFDIEYGKDYPAFG